MTTIMIVIFLILGLIIGSFSNLLIYRIPRGIQTIKGRSQCTHCHHDLKWYDLIPVFSYVYLKGQCRYCKQPIGLKYLGIEILMGGIYVFSYLYFGLSFNLAVHLLLFTIMAVIVVIDYEKHIIPDRFHVIIAITAVIYIIYQMIAENYTPGFNHLYGALLGFGILYAVRLIGTYFYKKEAMGFGDVKLLGVLGLFVGWQQIILVFFLSSIIAAVIEIPLIWFKVKSRESEIAFGPYLIYATVISIFYGQSIIDLYLSLFRR